MTAKEIVGLNIYSSARNVKPLRYAENLDFIIIITLFQGMKMKINDLNNRRGTLLAKAMQLRNDLDAVKEEIHSIDEEIKQLRKGYGILR
jgi:phosphatidate phosphatase PAH1